MSMASMCRDIGRALVIGGLAFQAPLAWAQPLEVADVNVTRAAVEAEVRDLIDAAAANDPELAQELERQTELCLRDLNDGHLEDAGLVKEVETIRDVQREVAGRVLQSEVESRIAEAVSRGNTELAESMRTAFEAFSPVGGADPSHMSEMGHEQAQAMFERAYQDAFQYDPQQAEHMKELFEAASRGNFESMRPSPELMEKMRQESEKYIAERPEMEMYTREFARVEFERFAEFGHEAGERFGPTDSPEQMHEAFERWASEGTHSAGEIEMYREMMEHGMMEMEHDMTAMEMEHYYESPEHYLEYQMPEREYYYDQRLEQQQQQNMERTVFEPHAGHFIDHDNDLNTPMVEHQHEIHYHSDGSRHDHTGG